MRNGWQGGGWVDTWMDGEEIYRAVLSGIKWCLMYISCMQQI